MAYNELAVKRPHILITGASGGLGSALAEHYASPKVRLTLWGRDEGRLNKVAEKCRRLGAEIAIIRQDIRNRENVRTIIEDIEMRHPIDMAILGAGVASGTLPNDDLEPIEDVCRTIEVNALGNMNMMATLLRPMLMRKSGHIVLICSVAALGPLDNAPTYAASKVALSYYGRGMRSFLSTRPIRISLVYPGYISTSMGCRFLGTKPLIMEPKDAAHHICQQLEAGNDDIKFPKLMAWGASLLNLLPESLAHFLLKTAKFTIKPDADSPAYAQFADIQIFSQDKS